MELVWVDEAPLTGAGGRKKVKGDWRLSWGQRGWAELHYLVQVGGTKLRGAGAFRVVGVCGRGSPT